MNELTRSNKLIFMNKDQNAQIAQAELNAEADEERIAIEIESKILQYDALVEESVSAQQTLMQ